MGGEFDFLMETEETTEETSRQLIEKAINFMKSTDDTYGGLDAVRLKRCLRVESTENIEHEHVVLEIDFSNIVHKSGLRLKELVIPEFVEEVRSQDSLINLVRCKYIEHIVVPSSVRVLTDGVFANYIRLKKVTFEADSKLCKIGENAFLNCEKLGKLNLENCEYLQDSIMSLSKVYMSR